MSLTLQMTITSECPNYLTTDRTSGHDPSDFEMVKAGCEREQQIK
jgi:hypothetical protein